MEIQNIMPSPIKDAFNIDLLNERCQHLVLNIKADQLIQAIRKADQQYTMGGDPSDVRTVEKNARSLWVPMFFKTIKSAIRLPKPTEITDGNAEQMLSDLITDNDFGDDSLSLRYLISSELLNMATTKDEEAMQIVKKLASALPHKHMIEMAELNDSPRPSV
jgi:hypothetical protein